jgi:hypothetical protein
MKFGPPISRESSISIYELIVQSRHGCGYVLATPSEKLETSLDPLERWSGIFAPGDLHVVLAKHSTAGNNFGRDGKGSARSLRA